MMKKKVLELIFIFYIGFFTVFAQSTLNAKTIMSVVAPKSPAAIPILKMVESNCMGENIEIDLQFYNSMEAMVTLASGKNYDVLIVPTHTAVNLYNKGMDVKLLNVFNWGGTYLSTTDPDCFDWEDLEGKELYVPARGSIPDILTQYFLNQNGLVIGKNIEVVYSTHIEIAQLIASGRIKYAVDAQPYVSLNLKKVKDYRVISEFSKYWELTQGKGYFMPGNCSVANSEYLSKNKDIVFNFDEKLSDVIEWAVENPEEAGKLANAYLNANAELITDAMPGFCFEYESAVDAKSDVERYCSVLCEVKPESIGNKIPDNDFFYIPK